MFNKVEGCKKSPHSGTFLLTIFWYLLCWGTVTVPLIVMLCQLLPKLLPNSFCLFVVFFVILQLFVILHKQINKNGLLSLVVTPYFVTVAQVNNSPPLGWQRPQVQVLSLRPVRRFITNLRIFFILRAFSGFQVFTPP